MEKVEHIEEELVLTDIVESSKTKMKAGCVAHLLAAIDEIEEVNTNKITCLLASFFLVTTASRGHIWMQVI